MAAPGSGGGGRVLLDALEELIAELPSRISGGRERLGSQALSALRSLVDELDLVTRDDLEELELRVAQLEHRMRLLEGGRDLPPAA
jgi:polyhydroxyalkanoate synthesis regulator phasin